ncbi:hypothetical protein [Clostridiisalibacter paucivorans]|uniref:hypothetical protein n=1 Tax=Clostridiisalibacter paucivorans TaxID=408753 RepID=UPI00047B929B|nr:hypothetical protein [Clostridiisalibacter paucivorans]
MGNMFKKRDEKRKGYADEILSAGKSKIDDRKEDKKYRSKEVESNKENKYRNKEYYNYRILPITNSRNGDKYKANFSLDEETMQRIKYIQMMTGITQREYSKIPEKAVELMYDIFFLLKDKDVNIFKDSLEDVIKSLRDIEV